MTEFIIFLIGLLLGGLIGVVMMCCLQINRLNNNHSKRMEVHEYEKKNR